MDWKKKTFLETNGRRLGHYSILFSDKMWNCVLEMLKSSASLQNPGGIIKPDNSLIFTQILIKCNLEGITLPFFSLSLYTNTL